MFCAIVMSIFVSCNQDDLADLEGTIVTLRSEQEGTTSQVIPDQKIILGNEINSPLEVENLNNAAQALGKPKIYSATHYTVKFTPQDMAEYQAILSDTNFFSFDFPLDHEIESYGTYYYDIVNESDVTPLWAQVKESTDLSVYNYTIKKRIYQGEIDSLVLKQSFITAGIDANKIYAYIEPDPPGNGGGCGGGGQSYNDCGCVIPSNQRRPAGCVRVEDSKRDMDPVRKMTIAWISSFLHSVLGIVFITETTDDGCFEFKNINNEQGDAMMVGFFKNKIASVSRILRPIRYQSKISGPSFNNIKVNFENSTVNDEHLYWGAATILNGVAEVRDNASYFGSTVGDNLHIWLCGDCEWSSFALNAKHISPLLLGAAFSNAGYNSSFAPLVVYAQLISFGFADAMAVNLLPDIFINASSDNSLKIKRNVYHELSHNMHFNKVGPLYWVELVNAEIKADGHGDQNSENAGLISLCESWAYHAEYTIAHREYSDIMDDYYLERLERSYNEKTNHVPEGLYYDLIDNNTIGKELDFVNVNVEGFEDYQIFNQLKSSVKSPAEFIEEFKNNEVADPQVKTAIDNLFNSYTQ